MRSTGYVPTSNIPFLVSLLTNCGRSESSVNYIICSVVPHIMRYIMHSLKGFKNTDKVLIVGQNLRVRLPMRYDSKLLGADRLVNVYGACVLHAPPCLVIDFGTAITFDYVSASGVFEGGLIVPGVEISGRALSEKTELLPRLGKKIKPVRSLVGRDTKAAMSSGLLNGFGALADGLIERFKKEYDRKIQVIVTGGFSKRIAPYMRRVEVIDPLHTIRSLEIMYRNELNKI